MGGEMKNLTGGLKFVYFHTTLRKTHIVPAGPQREKDTQVHRWCMHTQLTRDSFQHGR